MVEIIEEPDGDVIEDVDSDDLEQFYDALESKIDEDSDRPIEVKWDEMMKNLDVKIEKANHAKLKGTEFFKMGNLAQAESHYLDALQYLPNKDLVEKKQKQLDNQKSETKESEGQKSESEKSEKQAEKVEEPAAEVRSILHGNLSAVQKRNGQLKEAIENATESLRLNPSYHKVRLRRAEMYEENDQPHESMEDWKLILETDPTNRAARAAMNRLPPKIEEKNEKLKAEMFDGMKKLGDMCLKPFGLSTNNFKLEQNEGGSYNIKFEQ